MLNTAIKKQPVIFDGNYKISSNPPLQVNVGSIKEQEFISHGFIMVIVSFFLGVTGFIKTFSWSIVVGFYGIFFNFKVKKNKWRKWSYLKRFYKSFGTIWYSYPNPTNNQRMLPGKAILYGLFLPKVEVVRRYSKSWKALDPIYNHEFGKDLSLRGYFTDWWYRHRACQSVRNRLVLTEVVLTDKILEVYRDKGSVRLLSIACGAAQGVINVISNLKKQGINVQVTLVDFDLNALKYAKDIASKKGVSSLFTTKQVNMFRNFKVVKGEFDIVEMVGFLDYLDKNKSKELISYVRKELLSLNGYFITANIMFNLDWLFVRWNINWWMIYRTSSQFIKILKTSGFLQENVILMKEVHKVHCIAVCKNNKTFET